MIVKNVKIARSFSDQFFGLINAKNPRQMLFFTRFGLHTFLLSKSIDVLILNKDYRIVTLREYLRPNRLFFWHPIHNIVLELPAGTIKQKNLQLGDIITIQTAKEEQKF